MKSGEETSFELARQSEPILKQPEIILREALKYCFFKVGLRAANFPEGPEKALLLNHIYEHYGNHTPEEIRLAFDLALSAKLGLDTADVKCYESFSCLYFSTIMNAYRAWSVQVARQKEKEEKITMPEKTPEELEQIEKEYQEFLKTPLAKRFGK